jgi:hypothetical protein
LAGCAEGKKRGIAVPGKNFSLQKVKNWKKNGKKKTAFSPRIQAFFKGPIFTFSEKLPWEGFFLDLQGKNRPFFAKTGRFDRDLNPAG